MFFFNLALVFHSLPWQLAFQEIDKQIAYGLKVISSGLLDAKMSIHTTVSDGSSNCSVFSVRVVKLGFIIPVLFGQSKVNNVQDV